ncbi:MULTISPECIES: hypothetical protein [unclassified Kitasatospora]|uniref:hypothetical protein n=1 Tax=unclassified Kitasatospora TaxID=2633591 RepID=UPI003411C9EC
MTPSSRVKINLGTNNTPTSRVKINLGTGNTPRTIPERLRKVADDLESGRPADAAALRSVVEDLDAALRADRRAEAGAPQAKPGRS